MRRTSFSVFAGALVLAGLAGTAQASTISFTENAFADPGNKDAPLYGTPLADASSPNYAQSVFGTVGGDRRSPYQDNAVGADTLTYSILNEGGGPSGASATYDLFGVSTFKILWGSPDPYNHIEFFDTSNALVTITNIGGTDLNGSQLSCYGTDVPPPGPGPCNRLHWVEVTFSGEVALSKVVLSDDATAAFEYGLNLPPHIGGNTPLPAAAWLFGSVVAGGAGLGRWRKRKAKSVPA